MIPAATDPDPNHRVPRAACAGGRVRAGPARIVARDGLRSLILVEAEAGATTLPPPPVFQGFEFLEFAVDEDSGRRLGETLRGLGFHYAGRHRSKSVDLFR